MHLLAVSHLPIINPILSVWNHTASHFFSLYHLTLRIYKTAPTTNFFFSPLDTFSILVRCALKIPPWYNGLFCETESIPLLNHQYVEITSVWFVFTSERFVAHSPFPPFWSLVCSCITHIIGGGKRLKIHSGPLCGLWLSLDPSVHFTISLTKDIETWVGKLLTR